MLFLLPLAFMIDMFSLLAYCLTLGCCFQCRPGLWARGVKPNGRYVGTMKTTTYRDGAYQGLFICVRYIDRFNLLLRNLYVFDLPNSHDQLGTL